MDLIYYSQSEKGERQNNEDLVFCEWLKKSNCLLALCIDGIGGENGGDIAASLAEKSIHNYLLCLENISLENLKMAVINANNDIIEMQKNPRICHMGCVLTACVIFPHKEIIHIAHVGDTRVYAYSKETDLISKLTKDHSFIGELYDQGLLTEFQAMIHPKRNRIWRYLGAIPLDYFKDYVDVSTHILSNIDRILICTDGLYGVLRSKEIKAILAKEASAENATICLINKAYEQGSTDNISAIVIDKC